MINLDNLSFKQILKVRICELNLEMSSQQKSNIKLLNQHLKKLNIDWKPHIWLSDEWFSPDGVSGFAIPFSLTHKKLIKLETEYLGACEGSSSKEFFKLCCHETGHAIDNAYNLRLKKVRQKIFGLTSQDYPTFYDPDPNSQDYVTFLGDHYAQAHPDEDWAETFGFFISGSSAKGLSPIALEKFEYLKKTIINLKNKPFKINISEQPMHYKFDTRTVEDYLLEKRRNLNMDQPNFFSEKLRGNFSIGKSKKGKTYKYLLKNKNQITKAIHKKTGQDLWTISKTFDSLKDECKKRNFTLKYSERTSLKQVQDIIELHINDFVREGHTRVFM